MKPEGWKIGALCVVVGCMLTGCGEKLIDLTDSERAAVVNYSAHMITQFNSRQQEGYTPVSEELLDEKDAPEQEPKQEVKPENPSGNQTQGEPENPEENKGTLTEALQIAGLEAKIDGYKVQKDYIDSDVLHMTAANGTEYLVVKVRLINRGKKQVTCNMIKSEPEFALIVNDTIRVKTLTTILLNDLSTYTETIKRGEEKQVVLLFEVAKEHLEKISSLKMDVTVAGKTTKVAVK